ncbi:unnamed protein product [Aphanomyces euteiches]|uniref:FYVE-type domain-containing protein n=1 Tax=Aphanomyces euteiches TaxID=100861 RepID=A0A6G0X3I9_9STRA|nr:hypothetical protein Ae201684_008866 [Aphanomyces euteiches]KAH9152190.1 hypothetical protein AeRB84_005335 [Aphanomyces euteiches]
MSAKQPPPNFFHCPPLGRSERELFKELAIASAHELAEKSQLIGGPIQWELDSNERNVRVYAGKVAESKHDAFVATPFLSTIEVMGTMTEVFDLFRSQTTEEAKEYRRRFEKVTDDTINLYSIVPATSQTPQEMVGISWQGYKHSMDSFLLRRDACLLVVHHAFEFNGKPVWVRCIRSVELPSCPVMSGFVRMAVNCSGYVFTELDKPGCIGVTYIAHTAAGGSIGDYAQWLTDMTSRKRCRNLTDIDRFLRENRLSKTPFMRLDEAKPVALASSCFLCTRRFGPFSKKANCLKCGEVCCRRCIRVWHVKNRGFDAQAHVCTKCALGKQHDGEDRQAWWRSSRSTTTEGSRCGSEGYPTPLSRSAPTVYPTSLSRSASTTSPRLDNFELIVDSKVWSSKKRQQITSPA